MKVEDEVFGRRTCLVAAGSFLLGLVYLGMQLKVVQVEDVAQYKDAADQQSVWRVRTAGARGRILDRHGTVLAANRASVSIVCELAYFQRRTWEATIAEIEKAVADLARLLGRGPSLDAADIRRHIGHRERALPLLVFTDLSADELAVFAEHAAAHPGFTLVDGEERSYPEGRLASHVIGYVGRRAVAPDKTGNYRLVMPEVAGRAGVEWYYDDYLQGVPGERKLQVDARCMTIRQWSVLQAKCGPDLRLTLDAKLQRVVETELRGTLGACAVIDPRNGDVLALASSPDYDLNRFVPFLPASYYATLRGDPAKPLLNRAVGGTYAPGSTFKPIMALAGLACGRSADDLYSCAGEFKLGGMKLRCTARWGHGEMDLRHALMKSCNPYFCNLGFEIGTNRVISAARAFGLGSRTGLDFGLDAPGVVPDAEWKERHYREKWYTGDLVQMSIGQGMLLVTPLQMARVAGALGTGYLVTPHLMLGKPAERIDLPFPAEHLAEVRQGLRMVVDGDGERRGTGWRAGVGVPVSVAGKTGSAEVGLGARKRNNTWFIAYAPAEDPQLAVAMVIENGESGGGTVAPKVGTILRAAFHD